MQRSSNLFNIRKGDEYQNEKCRDHLKNLISEDLKTFLW